MTPEDDPDAFHDDVLEAGRAQTDDTELPVTVLKIDTMDQGA
jgi:hypothetical protein